MRGSNKSVAIDLMRGVSIFYIVGFWHLWDLIGSYKFFNNSITKTLTILALSLFVFLSGYLLAGGVGRVRTLGVVEFFKIRFLKIYPPFVLVACVFYFFGLINFPVFLKTVLLVSIFDGPTAPTIWFVGMISIFYLVTPAFVNLAKESRWKFLFAGGGFYLAYAALSYSKAGVDQRVLLYLPSFLAGIWFATQSVVLSLRGKAFGFLMVGASMLLMDHYKSGDPQFAPFFAPVAVFGAVSVYSILVEVEYGEGVSRFAAAIAAPAYMLFLVHRPVYAVVRRIYMPDSPLLQLLALYLIGVPVAYFSARYMQIWYDKLYARMVKRVF